MSQPTDPASGGQVSVWARNQVPLVNGFGALAVAVVGLLRTFGVPITNEQAVSLQTTVGVIALLVAGLLARLTATPLSDPRTATGERLIPESQCVARPPAGPVPPPAGPDYPPPHTEPNGPTS